jgi:predicted TIM-barrel fold metal-dependent hydrolase
MLPAREGSPSKAAMSQPTIDFHAHAFPDALAERAISRLEHAGGIKAFLDGRVASLLGSMDTAGIATSVICSIATKPEQFETILAWSQAIASPRIVPLASIHPRAGDVVGQARRVAEAGLAGIKLHPYYQGFDLDDETLVPLFRALDELGLIVVCHTGFDFAFARDRKADPVRILRVLDRVPTLRLITSHMGAWDDWDEVEKLLIGKPITMDISLSLDLLGRERARAMILAHPADRVLFGTDSPWGSQSQPLASFHALELGEERESVILWKNAQALLARA